MPAVSVVIPVYNRRQYVVEAVESALAQTFRDHEIIVVDDGSTDGTPDLLAAAFAGRIRVERFPENRGRSTARNAGWEMARGEFVAFLDSDDLWRPEKLARQVPKMDDPEVVLVHCWAGKIDAGGQPLEAETAQLGLAFAQSYRRGYHYAGITETWCRMYTSAAMVRRELLGPTGGFNPQLSNWEDWDLLWNIARLGNVATIPEPLLLHRAHAGNTPTRWEKDAIPWLLVIRRHLFELCALSDRRARRNLQINMSLGEYWRRDLAASRRWMWRALETDPRLLLQPAHVVWGAPLLHACLPHFLAARLVKRLNVDNYRTVEGQTA